MLVGQFVPGFTEFLEWPFIIIGVGLTMLVVGGITGIPALAIPACIVGGIGGILYYQSVTEAWQSWAYMWTLIPGFVGVGIILMNFLEGRFSQAFRDGIGLIVISLIMFAFFGAILGGPSILGQFWPVLLILWGLWLLVRSFFRPRTEV
jgi:hypothetical protein